jgi:hypothetical protein
MKKILPLLSVLIFLGCEKDDYTENILSRSWQITAVSAETDGVRRTLNVSSFDEKRIFAFRKDGSFLNEPSPGCTSSWPSDVFTGTWSLVDNKILRAEGQAASAAMFFQGEIIILTKSKLVVRSTVDPFGGGSGRPFSEVTTVFSSR